MNGFVLPNCSNCHLNNALIMTNNKYYTFPHYHCYTKILVIPCPAVPSKNGADPVRKTTI